MVVLIQVKNCQNRDMPTNAYYLLGLDLSMLLQLFLVTSPRGCKQKS